MIKIDDNTNLLKKHIENFYKTTYKKKTEPTWRKELELNIVVFFEYLKTNYYLKSILINENDFVFLKSVHNTNEKHIHYLKFYNSKNQIIFHVIFREDLFKSRTIQDIKNNIHIKVFDCDQNSNIKTFHNKAVINNLNKINILNNPLLKEINKKYRDETRKFLNSIEDKSNYPQCKYFRKIISKSIGNRPPIINSGLNCVADKNNKIKEVENWLSYYQKQFLNNIDLESDYYRNLYKNKRIVHKMLKNLKIKHFFQFIEHDNHDGLYCHIENESSNAFNLIFKIEPEMTFSFNQKIEIIFYNQPSHYPIQETDYTISDLLNNFDDLNQNLNLQYY